MSLSGIIGRKDDVNQMVVRSALEDSPSIIVDCANCTDIQRFRDARPEWLMSTFIVPAESLYRLLPTLRRLPVSAARVGTERIFVSTFTHLFDYDDKAENQDVFELAWRILEVLSGKFSVMVAVEKGTIHEMLAGQHGIKDIGHIGGGSMGHTNASQRIVSDALLSELGSFGRVLREEDRVIYERLLREPLKHLGSISYASSLDTWAFLLLCIALEQQKMISSLEARIKGLS